MQHTTRQDAISGGEHVDQEYIHTQIKNARKLGCSMSPQDIINILSNATQISPEEVAMLRKHCNIES